MNFKKNWKRFWTLSSAREGFTLVELIVVIAILAILAGVAVPAYSGYVTKANKQADMTLASEVAHALTLYYYAHPDEVTGGYVILTKEGVPCRFGGFGEAAMDAVFGDGWENTVSLKYDGWNGSLYAAAANQPGIGAVGSSPFIQGNDATGLVTKVQDLNEKAVGLLGQKTDESICRNMSLYLGDGFVDFCNGLGIEKVNSETDGGYVFGVEASSDKYDFEVDGKYYTYPTDEQMSNLMTLYVSDGVGNTAGSAATEINYSEFLFQTMMNSQALNPDGSPKIDAINTNGLTMTEYLAVSYAMYTVIAEQDATGTLADALEDVNDGLTNASSMGDVLTAMNSFWSNPEVLNNCGDYLAGGFTTDMDAVIATLGAAGDVAGDYYDDISDLNNGNFFSSEEVTNALDSFIGSASGMAGLSDEARVALGALGEGEVAVAIGSTGVVSNSIGN